MSSLLHLGFTGDVMLGRRVDETYRESRSPSALWGTVAPTLRGLDGLFVNLECCLSTRGEQWPGRRFHFRAHPDWATDALRYATVDCCTLANNHAMDFGPDALEETLEALSGADIATVGAGRSTADAREPAAVDCRGLTVAVIGFTDNVPAYGATADRAGTAHVEFDPKDDHSISVLAEAVERATELDPDLLVASLHWGPNNRTEPPERHRQVARILAEWGVDFIHGHSAHVFQGIEILTPERRDSPTVVCYDMGDFVDDYAVDPVGRNDRSFLFELVVAADGTLVELICHPTEIESQSVYHAGKRAAGWCRKTMQERSAVFGTEFDSNGTPLTVSLV